MPTFKILVAGKVQGVYFRVSTLKKALELNIKGTVENTQNGGVLIYAEGEKLNIETFSKWCGHGPVLAKVNQLQVDEIPFKGYKDFVILKD